MSIVAGKGRVRCIVAVFLVVVGVPLVTVTMSCDLEWTPGRHRTTEIHDWYDLDGVRYHLGGSFILMNDLDVTTVGYEELASETANEGNGWQPIGTSEEGFAGSFEGQGYEIRDLSINRPAESFVGLFRSVDKAGVIQNVGVHATVSGEWSVGALSGANWGTLSNCYSMGSVSGDDCVGGLVGGNSGSVSDSYSTAAVTGHWDVGGLVGANDHEGTVSDSYTTGNVNGRWSVGGLVGGNWGGSVSRSWSGGSVSGEDYVGGLVGDNQGALTHAYATGSVTGEWQVGGLVGYNEGSMSSTYSTGGVTGSIWVGGLVGNNREGAVRDSFWDRESSGIGESDGGTGMTTKEMQTVVTFTSAGWDIAAVPVGQTDDTYTWNMVDGETYPFLSWEST